MYDCIGMLHFIMGKKSKSKLICQVIRYTAYDNKQKFSNYKKVCKLT